MLLHYLAKLKTRKMHVFTLIHVDLPIVTQVTLELSPNHRWTTIHS